jgi:hypothetical protein
LAREGVLALDLGELILDARRAQALLDALVLAPGSLEVALLQSALEHPRLDQAHVRRRRADGKPRGDTHEHLDGQERLTVAPHAAASTRRSVACLAGRRAGRRRSVHAEQHRVGERTRHVVLDQNGAREQRLR